jgi:hypothetical protein
MPVNRLPVNHGPDPYQYQRAMITVPVSRLWWRPRGVACDAAPESIVEYIGPNFFTPMTARLESYQWYRLDPRFIGSSGPGRVCE